MTRSQPTPDSEIPPSAPSAHKLKTHTESPAIEPLTTDDVLHLLQADMDLWSQPLTPETIQMWHALSKDWSWKYNINSQSAGLFYCIPLNKTAFSLLKRGLLDEHSIKAEHIWRDDDDCRGVGIHIFHIEKEDSWRRDWGRMMNRVFVDLHQLVEFKKVDVLGYSALAVTADGFKGFKSSGFELMRVEKSGAADTIAGAHVDTKVMRAWAVGFEKNNGYWFLKEGRD